MMSSSAPSTPSGSASKLARRLLTNAERARTIVSKSAPSSPAHTPEAAPPVRVVNSATVRREITKGHCKADTPPVAATVAPLVMTQNNINETKVADQGPDEVGEADEAFDTYRNYSNKKQNKADNYFFNTQPTDALSSEADDKYGKDSPKQKIDKMHQQKKNQQKKNRTEPPIVKGRTTNVIIAVYEDEVEDWLCHNRDYINKFRKMIEEAESGRLWKGVKNFYVSHDLWYTLSDDGWRVRFTLVDNQDATQTLTFKDVKKTSKRGKRN